MRLRGWRGARSSERNLKVLFLDIDGVLNYEAFFGRFDGAYGIDDTLAAMVRDIVLKTGAKIVLSSAWRGSARNEDYISQRVGELHDRTKRLLTIRGEEIKEWLDRHTDVEGYAILDDDSDMLPEQLTHFFQTSWKTGITPEVASAVVRHLSYGDAST